jgi:hypothetical protein
MFILARLRRAKWQLLGSVVVVILLCGLGLRFLSSLSLPSLTRDIAPRVAANSPEQKKSLPRKSSSQMATEMKVYKNPETGRFENPPIGPLGGRGPSAHPGPSGAPGQEPTTPPLSEWLSPVGGGGVVTNVRLRFRRPLVATKDADGVLTIQHASDAAHVDEAR